MKEQLRYNRDAMSNPASLEFLKPIFWDIDFTTLSWEENRDFIIKRILTQGDLEMIRWLRKFMGDQALTQWMLDHRGASLTPRQLRYWEIILNIPTPIVDQWIAAGSQSTWQQRSA